MKLEKFRIQNYKNITDTDWVKCRDLTAFVGVNEAGKSAIFQGLAKLNPSDGEKYDGMREFPRRRYSAEYKLRDWPVASGKFVLDEDDISEMVAASPLVKDVTKVIVTRYYSWKLEIGFSPKLNIQELTIQELLDGIQDARTKISDLTAPDGEGKAIETIKIDLERSLGTFQSSLEGGELSGSPTKKQIDDPLNCIKQKANEGWQKEILDPLAEPFQEMSKILSENESVAEAKKWVEGSLPKFIYFGKYGVIDSHIHIPSFLKGMEDQVKGPLHRVTLCLFKHVGIDLQTMLKLGTYDTLKPDNPEVRRNLDELSILADSASVNMTDRFRNWWDQRKHKFHYEFQGEYFKIWVSDDSDPSIIDLDQRSQGLQYFFSFYLVFLVESEEAHKGCILLLDEPGLYLHCAAQARAVKFLKKLATENQTLYSTHSPFLLDVDHLEDIRTVHADENGVAQVSDEAWPSDKNTLFPLQAALGYQLVRAYFFSKKQLLVEGITDYWLIKTISKILPTSYSERLRADITVIPAAGAPKLLPLASMLLGHDIEIGALLDGDEPGRREGKKLDDSLLSGSGRRCLFIGDFLDGHAEGEIEDIFPDDYYLTSVKEASGETEISFNDDEKAIPGIVDRVTALFKRKGFDKLEKWRVCASLRDRMLDKPAEVPDTVYVTMSKVFEAVNSMFIDHKG